MTPLVGDVTDPGFAPAAVEAALELGGRLDLLVNGAGTLRFEHSHEADLGVFEQVLAVNLTGTFRFCRAAIPALLEQRGAIVNVASTSSTYGHPWAAAYASSKGGVLALTKTLAIEYAKQGLRVNADCPGSIETPIIGQFHLPEGADGKLLHRIMSPTGMAPPVRRGRRHRLPGLRRRPPRQRRGPPHRRRHPHVSTMQFCYSATFSSPEELVPLAQAGDDAGWSTPTLSDHLINPVETRSTYPYTKDGARRWEMGTPWPDPWVTVGHLSAVTTRLRFLTTVYILPARMPVHVAKQVGTAAVLSGNRVDLGGWMAGWRRSST